MKKIILILIIIILFNPGLAISKTSKNKEPGYAGTLPSTNEKLLTDEEEQAMELIFELTKLIIAENGKQIPNKKLAGLYYFRGYIYEETRKDKEKALSDYNLAVKYDSTHKKAYLGISTIKQDFKDYEGAIQAISESITLEPNDPTLYLARAMNYAKLEIYDNVIKDCTKSILLKNKNPIAFSTRGLAELKIGLKQKGLQDLNYAKQQFYEINDIKNYKLVVDCINASNNPVYIPAKTPPSNNYFPPSTNYILTSYNDTFAQDKQRQREHQNYMDQMMLRHELGNIADEIRMQNIFLRWR